MNKKFFCCFFSVFLMSCSTRQAEQSDLPLNGDRYIIDLDVERDTSIPLSSLFKNVRTIVLETGDSYLIGSLDDLQVFDGYIYILDSRKAKSLFVFDMEGRFIRKIGRVGNGPGEYSEIKDFTLDTKNGFIFLLGAVNRVLKYQLDGTYVYTISIQEPNTISNFIQFYDGKLYSYSFGKNQSLNDYMLLETDPEDGKVLSRSLPVKYNKGWTEPFFYGHSRFFMSRTNNPPRYNQMFMDYIVSIGKEITPYIELKSKYLTTEKNIEDFRSDGAIRVNSGNILNSKRIFNVNCFVENDNFINFRCGINPASSFAVILNKKTEEVKLVNYLSNDLIYKQDRKGGLGRFVFADEKGAYDILDTQSFTTISNFKTALMNDEIVPDLDKIDQLKQLDAESNPVIFFYAFK